MVYVKKGIPLFYYYYYLCGYYCFSFVKTTFMLPARRAPSKLSHEIPTFDSARLHNLVWKVYFFSLLLQRPPENPSFSRKRVNKNMRRNTSVILLHILKRLIKH